MFHSIINYLTGFTAQDYYHAAAFILTGAGAQYSVQLIKIISKNKFGKTALRFLNGAFSTLFVAAGALATGGLSLGSITVTSAAVATFSAVIYRIHNSILYKTASNEVSSATTGTAEPAVAPVVPASQFAE